MAWRTARGVRSARAVDPWPLRPQLQVPKGVRQPPLTGTTPTSGQAFQQAHGALICELYRRRRVGGATGRRCVQTERNRTRERLQAALRCVWANATMRRHFCGALRGTQEARGRTRCEGGTGRRGRAATTPHATHAAYADVWQCLGRVSHTCGNAWCVRPSHLAVVLAKDNKITIDGLRPTNPLPHDT